MSIPFTTNQVLLNAVGQTATSDYVDVSKRQEITVQFTATGGSSVFTLDASNDGTNWITSIAFLDPTATATGTYVTQQSLSSTTAGAIVKPGWRYLRAVCTWTSGTGTAVLQSGG
jgi:hypothetical protein